MNTEMPPWGSDDIVLIREKDRQELDVYGCLRRIAAMSYEEKLRIWKRKQANAKALENRRAERFRQIERMQAGVRPKRGRAVSDAKTRILEYLHAKAGAWVTINQLAQDLGIPYQTVKNNLAGPEIEHATVNPRGSRRHFVRISTGIRIGSTPSAPITKNAVFLSALVLDEWISAALVPLSRKRRNWAIGKLRHMGYVIDTRVERSGHTVRTFYRLVSVPNPAQGKGEQ